MLTSLVILSACKPEPPPEPVFEPVAVGFGFDGALSATGAPVGYAIGTDQFAAVMVLQFVSQTYLDTEDSLVRAAESCVAIATFEPPPLVPPAQIPTVGDAPLFVSYDSTLYIDASSCGAPPNTDGDGKADPELWGENGQDLTDPFDGAHFGFGLGPMTDTLRESWTSETLEEVGGSMLASWIAINDLDGGWVASDWTTAIAFDFVPETGQLLTQISPVDGSLQLVPLEIGDLTTEDVLPPLYIQSYPNAYQDFELLDLGNL